MDNQFFSSLEYIFIFDYYDSPLFFISQSSENNRYYLFYSIDDDAYFFSELSASDINYLFMNPNGYDILHYLKDKSKLKFVLISKKSFNTIICQIKRDKTFHLRNSKKLLMVFGNLVIF
ncbi:RpiR family transcriptional regulator [Enterococcus faecium]|nr:RpiR family transcriptional regulator [Enterococcus faecium]SMM30584.1 RpiR family transcriptional regulator [Enterococcus faecium]